jgi:nucleoside phosphorylase
LYRFILLPSAWGWAELPIGFSTIISAVKPRERTDQYVILAALHSLSAETTPTTVKQISDLLKLHLGKKAPPNVAASLRKYGAYVEPFDAGPPIRWRLKPEGIAKLRAISDLALAVVESEHAFETDIGIICALEQPEFDAVRDALGGVKTWKEIGDARFAHVYRESSLLTNSGKALRVVATASTSMGLTAAAIATTQLILQFRPRLVVMIGIAAGTRSGGKEFGDVLVADPSVDYNSGKVVDLNGIREFLPDPYPLGLNPRLRSVLRKYASNAEVFAAIRRRWSGGTPSKPNRLHMGPLGAADQVIDDPSRILEITKNWRKLVGVEMETYGVYRACHESPDPKPRMVSFKAVCDFAADKTDSWQDYAAFMAAQFTVDFLKTEWDALWPVAE